MDLWPDIMLPAYSESRYYSIYYVIFLLLFLILFTPIPMAVVYENYRHHRILFLRADRIKRRHALLYCFLTLSYDK